MGPVVRIPDLKQMASVSVALALWSHVDIYDTAWLDMKNEVEPSTLVDVAPRLAEELTVPQSITKNIATYAKKIWQEIQSWVNHLSTYILHTERKYNKLYLHINDIIWYADGTIDYKRTAKNLLNSLRLSELEKYHILCFYCLKDEIEHVSPLLFTNKVVDHVDFECDPLIYYWNCYFRNELHKVPVDGNLPLDIFMFRHEDINDWPAQEYFFDQLSAEEQVRNVIWLIDNDGLMYLYQKRLLMKLTESQLLQVYVDRAAKIIENYRFTKNNFQDILATWYDVCDLITQDQFVEILMFLLSIEISGDVLTNIWTSAGDDFKRHILNYQDRIVFKEAMNWSKRSKDSSFMATLLQDVNADVKLEIITMPFFDEFCQNLISEFQLSTLENLLNLWSPIGDQLVQFKRNFIRSPFFIDICEKLVKLYLYGEDYLPMLEHLWNIMFSDVEEVTRFKQEFTTKGFFNGCCESLIGSLPKLEKLLNLFLPDDGRFEQNLVQKDYFIDECKHDIKHGNLNDLKRFFKICISNTHLLARFKGDLLGMEWFKKHCEKLIRNDKIDTLERVFKLCLSNSEKSARFKRDLVTAKFSGYGYYDSDSDSDSNYDDDDYGIDWSVYKINKLLKLCLPKTQESATFMRDLANDSDDLKSHCLMFYGIGDVKHVNNLLTALFLSYMDVVVEFKKNLLMSPDVIEKNVYEFLWSSRRDELDKVIADVFPEVGSANEYKKLIVFSPKVIQKLRNSMVSGKGLIDVKERIDGFLSSDEDRSALKKQLIDGIQSNIVEMFHKYGDTDWTTLMRWCLESEEDLQALKGKLPVDKIFESRLQECIFQTYDDSRVSRCSLKKDLDFASLDEFLAWCFVSANELKEYKLQRINSYEDLKPISTLLEKNCHSSYLKKLLDWFFENDQVEMAKFKKKHKGKKIVNMVRIVRESYIK